MLCVPRPVLPPIPPFVFAVGLAAGGPGCIRHVLLTSDPIGARVERRGEELGTTPLEIDVWKLPFSPQRVTLSLPGYRTVEMPLNHRLGWLRMRTTQELVLIPDHGPAGTWTPEEAREAR